MHNLFVVIDANYSSIERQQLSHSDLAEIQNRDKPSVGQVVGRHKVVVSASTGEGSGGIIR